jgi:hypothetical protein
MTEVKAITVTHKELVEALIKHQNYHEGIWQLFVEFGISAANIKTGEDQISPSAIVPIVKIGLIKVETESPIAVDAAKINPSN